MIRAEVWEKPKLAIPHSKPYSRHTDVERARGAIRLAYKVWPNVEPGYFVLLVFKDGCFEPVEVER